MNVGQWRERAGEPSVQDNVEYWWWPSSQKFSVFCYQNADGESVFVEGLSDGLFEWSSRNQIVAESKPNSWIEELNLPLSETAYPISVIVCVRDNEGNERRVYITPKPQMRYEMCSICGGQFEVPAEGVDINVCCEECLEEYQNRGKFEDLIF
jgi:hypothetical protein